MAKETIQRALGRNAKRKHPAVIVTSAALEAAGQAVIDSIAEYIRRGYIDDDGSALVHSIYSQHLRTSALFSARAARMAYLLGKASLLRSDDRKAVVRTQIIEYGAVAEAILLDVVQSAGKHDKPSGLRPPKDNDGTHIDWRNDGLFTLKAPSTTRHKHKFPFLWLTKQALHLTAIDAKLKARIDWLRESRNLVHPVIPTAQRYKDDLNSARRARVVVVDLRDASVRFKKKYGLPLPPSA